MRIQWIFTIPPVILGVILGIVGFRVAQWQWWLIDVPVNLFFMFYYHKECVLHE